MAQLVDGLVEKILDDTEQNLTKTDISTAPGHIR
jgi:hypothetical protein